MRRGAAKSTSLLVRLVLLSIAVSLFACSTVTDFSRFKRGDAAADAPDSGTERADGAPKDATIDGDTADASDADAAPSR